MQPNYRYMGGDIFFFIYIIVDLAWNICTTDYLSVAEVVGLYRCSKDKMASINITVYRIP